MVDCGSVSASTQHIRVSIKRRHKLGASPQLECWNHSTIRSEAQALPAGGYHSIWLTKRKAAKNTVIPINCKNPKTYTYAPNKNGLYCQHLLIVSSLTVESNSRPPAGDLPSAGLI